MKTRSKILLPGMACIAGLLALALNGWIVKESTAGNSAPLDARLVAKKKSIKNFLNQINQSLDIILAHKSFETYFTSRALEDYDGQLDAEFELEEFFVRIVKAKPDYLKILLVTASGTPAMLINRRGRSENFQQIELDEISRDLIPKILGEGTKQENTHKVFHALTKDVRKEWTIQSAAAIAVNGNIEGVIIFCQKFNPLLKNIFSDITSSNIYFVLSQLKGDVILHTPHLSAEHLKGLKNGDLEDWTLASDVVPELKLKIILGQENKRGIPGLGDIFDFGWVMVGISVFFLVIVLGFLVKNIFPPRK